MGKKKKVHQAWFAVHYAGTRNEHVAFWCGAFYRKDGIKSFLENWVKDATWEDAKKAGWKMRKCSIEIT